MSQNNKPTIIHIIDRLPPDGAERLLVDVVKNASGRFDYRILCLVEGGLLVDELEKASIPVQVIGRSGKFDLTLLWRLVKILRAHKPCVVHTHLFTADAWGRFAAWLCGVKGIYSTIHSTNAWKGRLYRIIDRLLAKVTTQVIACSDEVANVIIRDAGIDAKKVITIANGVDFERVRSSRPLNVENEFNIQPCAIKLALVGRLHDAKGHMDILPVIYSLSQIRKDFHVFFIGSGELEGSIRNFICRYKLEDHVTLTGQRNDVSSILSDIDIVLMPSRWEGLPMSLLESMALGKTVIATKVGGIPNVIDHNVDGMLADAGNMAAMEESILQLMDDASLRERLGNSARMKADREYSAKGVSEKYEAMYQMACR